MKVLFIARTTLYNVYGGDTVQIVATAKYLRLLGVEVDIKLSNEVIDYAPYDLLHFFNIIRPADHLPHISRSKKPYLVSTIFVDFSDYERTHRQGIMAFAGKLLSADGLEYAKAWARWVKNGERIASLKYMLRGHRKAVQFVAKNAAALLPNSSSEYHRFLKQYELAPQKHFVVYNGIDPDVFSFTDEQINQPRDAKKVICISRIEGKKNQLNLIKALNNTEFELTLIGAPAPNHLAYFEACKNIASTNIHFLDFLPQEELANYYLTAKVHVLPSWNETCGLSTMEAGYAGCNVVITNKGDTEEYFGDHAWYCEPNDPASIYEAVKNAAKAPIKKLLRDKITQDYTWNAAATQTLNAYREVLQKISSSNHQIVQE